MSRSEVSEGPPLGIVVRETYPCDEDPEKTSEREESAGGGNRLALGEEHLDGRAEEHKVDPCDERMYERARTEGGQRREEGGGRRKGDDGGRKAHRRRTTRRRARRARRGKSRWPYRDATKLVWLVYVVEGIFFSTVTLLLRLLRMGLKIPAWGSNRPLLIGGRKCGRVGGVDWGEGGVYTRKSLWVGFQARARVGTRLAQ
jgi:hypothetical protein